MKVLDWWQTHLRLRLLYYHPSLSFNEISCLSPPLAQFGHLLEVRIQEY